MFPFTAVSVSSFEALVGKRTRASRTGTLRLLVRAKDSEGRGELASSFVSLVVTLTCVTLYTVQWNLESRTVLYQVLVL